MRILRQVCVCIMVSCNPIWDRPETVNTEIKTNKNFTKAKYKTIFMRIETFNRNAKLKVETG